MGNTAEKVQWVQTVKGSLVPVQNWERIPMGKEVTGGIMLNSDGSQIDLGIMRAQERSGMVREDGRK
jgi:hypothetical protein